jgi:hypothetical protein
MAPEMFNGEAYRDDVKAELWKAVDLLSADEQTAVWALATTACRPSRQGAPKSLRCVKYDLHLLRDKETNAITEAYVRARKITCNGGVREGCLARPSVERLSAMYARVDLGKQA